MTHAIADHTCAPTPPSWPASLSLHLRRGGDRTRLQHCAHSGPLRVQRLLYPEGADCAHALLLHPPGGIAGGDQLSIGVELQAGAQALLTTPGAAKWYHGQRGAAQQKVQLRIAAGACLEWLPQESILFNGSRVEQSTSIELDDNAALFGWDIVQLGRMAADAHWLEGTWQQRLQLKRRGHLCWLEQARLSADDPLRRSPLGLAGHPVFACAFMASPLLEQDVQGALSAARTAAVRFALPCGISWLEAPTRLLLIRALAPRSDLVRNLLETLWNSLRPWLAGRHAHRPRIWDT